MKIGASVDILSRPSEVFLWITNPDKAMHWQKGVKSGEIIRDTSGKIGTTFKEELEENGKTLVMYGEIIDYIQDQLISFKLESKIHRVYVNYLVTWDEHSSTVGVDSTIKWKFPMNILSLIIGKKIREKIQRQTRSELLELKKLCESEGNEIWRE